MSAAGLAPPLNVAQVTAAYPPALGGVEVVAQQLSAHLAASGSVVDVLTTDVGAAGSPRTEVGAVRVRRHRAVQVAHTPVAPGLLISLLRLPRRTVVHVHVAQAFVVELVWLVCALRRLPLIAHVHLDVDASGPAGRLLPAYKRLVLGPVLRSADRVIALTGSMKEFLLDRYRLDRAKVDVVPNAVDARFFNPVTDPAEAETHQNGPLRVLFVGRLSVQKNLPRLLGALAGMRELVEAVVVGDGADRSDHERLASRLGLTTVRFVGAADPDGVRRWLAWADVLAMPSDKEGLPLVALEAMAAGVPVVATDVPGLRELVDGPGLLVPASEAGLAEGLDRLAGDAALRHDLAERGRSRAAEHSWPSVTRQVQAVYAAAGVGGAQ